MPHPGRDPAFRGHLRSRRPGPHACLGRHGCAHGVWRADDQLGGGSARARAARHREQGLGGRHGRRRDGDPAGAPRSNHRKDQRVSAESPGAWEFARQGRTAALQMLYQWEVGRLTIRRSRRPSGVSARLNLRRVNGRKRVPTCSPRARSTTSPPSIACSRTPPRTGASNACRSSTVSSCGWASTSCVRDGHAAGRGHRRGA